VTLRVAIVGAGQMGRFHARVVNELEATDLVAIVDPDPAAERVARTNAARWLRSTEELVLDPPDFVVVTIPTTRHREVGIPLLEAGIPLLIEKPLAATVEEARELTVAASRFGVPLAVGHVERFNPAVQALQAKLAEGQLGRIFQIHARRLSPFPIRVGDSGVAIDLATHDLDVMATLVGEPVRISAETDQKAHRTHEDLLAALIRFDSGTVGLLEVNWLTPDKIRQLTVTGERGTFVVDYLNQHLTLYENAHATDAWETLAIFEGVTEGNVTRFALPRAEPLRLQLEAFVRAVRGEVPVVVTGDDGVRAVRLALAIVEAGSTNRTVRIDPHADASLMPDLDAAS
jgi:UDP-N-acetylglucosamine 3-dehydrogenase